MKSHQILILIVFSIISELNCAQNYSITHFDEKNGFNARTIYNIAQDQEGFIWIGTNTGLKRYDGINFKNYGIEDGLTDLEIFNINVDKQNHIYFHNFSNTANFYYKNRFYNSKNDESLKNLKFNQTFIADYCPYSNAFLLSAAEKSYFYYLKVDNGIIIEKEKISLKEGEVISQIIATNNLYYVFYKKNNLEKIFYKVFKRKKIVGESILEGIISFSTLTGINNKLFLCPNEDKKKVYCYKIDESNLLNLSYDVRIDNEIRNLFNKKNELWLTLVEGGVSRLDSTTLSPPLLKDKTVNNLLIDNQSNIWIGTNSSGLYLIKSHSVTNLLFEGENSAKSVISLCDLKNGEILAGFDKLAFARIDSKKKIKTYNFYTNKGNISRRVTRIAYDNKETIFFGTDGDIFKTTITELNKKPKFRTLSNITSIKDIQLISKDELWVGSSMSLIIINKSHRIKTDFNMRVLSLEIDNDNTLWIGTLYGLYSKKNNDTVFSKYNLEGLNSKKINDIKYYRKGLYLATDSGICYLDLSKNLAEFMTKKNNLISNQCNRISIYKNNLWVATASGVSKLSLRDENNTIRVISNISRKDGISSNYINDILITNDTVWAATNEGISLFSINFKKRKNRLNTNIIEARSNSLELDLNKNIELKPNENNISISFSSMLFETENNQKFLYRLLPNNKTWSSTLENTISFSELNPGEYTFEVVNADNIGMGLKDSLTFKVNSRIYQTTWFRIILGFLLITAILYSLYLKNKKNEERFFIENTITQLELEAIKAQINPHFIYNCLNSIKSTIMKKETLKAEEQLSVFAKLVRQTLINSKNNYISINSEIEYLNNYLEMEKIRFKDELNYSINVEKLNQRNNIKIPSMLIQPFIENSIKHGIPEDENIKANITVNFVSENSTLLCYIEDNGPGISKTIANKVDSSHTSYGMNITSKRAEKFNKLFNTNIQIKAFEKKEGGTCVKIEIPIII